MTQASDLVFYTADTPNGQKVSIFLKEAGLVFMSSLTLILIGEISIKRISSRSIQTARFPPSLIGKAA